MKKQLVALTKDLIGFKTTKNELDEINKCIDYIVRYLSPYDLIIKKYVCDEKPSLVVTFDDTKSPEIFLLGHVDVVEARNDDFKPKIQENKLFGRGSIDMKAGVVIIMKLMTEFAKQRQKPSMGLMITSDEESNGNCSKYLIDQENYSCRFAVVLEGTNLQIATEGKGFIFLKIRVKGISSHGSTPWLGDNAIEKLIEAYAKIKKLFLSTSKNPWGITLNLGKFSGGDSINKVPDSAELFLDIRYSEPYEKNKIMNKIQSIPGIEIEELNSGNALKTSVKNVYVQKIKQKANKILGRNTQIIKLPTTSDGRFFSKKGIPTIVFGPKGKNYHGKNEYVEIDSLVQCYTILRAFIFESIGDMSLKTLSKSDATINDALDRLIDGRITREEYERIVMMFKQIQD